MHRAAFLAVHTVRLAGRIHPDVNTRGFPNPNPKRGHVMGHMINHMIRWHETGHVGNHMRRNVIWEHVQDHGISEPRSQVINHVVNQVIQRVTGHMVRHLRGQVVRGNRTSLTGIQEAFRHPVLLGRRKYI